MNSVLEGGSIGLKIVGPSNWKCEIEDNKFEG